MEQKPANTDSNQLPAVYSTKRRPDINLKTLKLRPPSSFSGRPKLTGRARWLALAMLLSLLSGFAGGWLGVWAQTRGNNSIATSTEARQKYISNESQLIESIARNVGQSVVSVDVQGQDSTTDFFGFSQPQATKSAGTGFIISADGIIVTNRHVVPSGTTAVSVTLSDGTKFDNVEVIGRTADSSSQDIAFLKIQDLSGKTLAPVTLGDSSKVQIGDKVVAIGNALGQFQNTVTSGIISGFGRDVTAGDQSGTQSSETLTDLFQTDTAINQGNSGGPLVNINGEVIGVNTAVASGAQNIGFAQPVNDLKGLIGGILSSGKIEQPYLGVRYVSLTNDLAKEFNLKVNRGAYILSGNNQTAVVEGSPAARAGLKNRDVIIKINDIKIDDKTSLSAALSRFKVGDQVSLSVNRDGKILSLKVSLANTPAQ